MTVEALEIIRELFDGGLVTYSGEHYRVDSARLWDLPETRVPIGVAAGALGFRLIPRFPTAPPVPLHRTGLVLITLGLPALVFAAIVLLSWRQFRARSVSMIERS